jgi:hypothetical protein
MVLLNHGQARDRAVRPDFTAILPAMKAYGINI